MVYGSAVSGRSVGRCCCHIQIANMIGVYRLENKYFTNITPNNFAHPNQAKLTRIKGKHNECNKWKQSAQQHQRSIYGKSTATAASLLQQQQQETT